MLTGKFQVIMLVIFMVAAIVGVLVFSGALPIGKDDPTATGQGVVVVWGTVPAAKVFNAFDSFNKSNSTFITQYVEKSEATFNQDLLEALASGQGPDLFLLPDNLALSYENKLFTIPYQSYPVATFKANFGGAGEVFAKSTGIMALPLTIDPMVLYYNKSILDAKGVVQPPAYWDDFANSVATLTEKDESNRILKSGAALGQYTNVTNAKEIIAALFMQAGNPIVRENNGTFASVLNDFTGNYTISSILSFFTSFSNPLSNVYSWNRSFPNSRDSFSAENLVFYLGYASELESLVNKNPNQNFFVAPFPQIRGATFKLTGGKVLGVAISPFSKNFNTAYIAANAMAHSDFAKNFAEALGVAPARRDLLAAAPNNAFAPTFYASALYARTWLDPAPKESGDIFRLMVDNVLSGSLNVQDAIKDAGSKLGLLLIN